jgi:hypothetical protein
MLFLRVLSAVFFVVICIYTFSVVTTEGWNFFPSFFDNLFAVTWAGQINLDFSFYLMSTALWVAWRNNFTVVAVATAVVVGIGGMLLMAAYLCALTFTSNGSLVSLLLGNKRAAALKNA